MKIRLGAIGPRDSIEIVEKAVKEFDEITLMIFPYEKMEDIETIIPQNKQFVDQWFFSGQAPYNFALHHNLIHSEEGSFVPKNSNSVYKTLLEAQLQEKKIFKNISLDTIQSTEELMETSLRSITIHSLSYTGYVPNSELIEFHTKLYEQGKVDVAVTCINNVYNSLRKSGIPCYRVTPDMMAIRLIIQYLKQRGVTQWYRKAQIAILGIEISESDLDSQFTYKMKHKELELKRLLLNYAEKINGSYVEIGDGRYFIYTTRGEVEFQLEKESLFDLIMEADVHSKFTIRIGLGYGITALEAEQNARLATQYARVKQRQCIIIVDETKRITEFEDQQNSISYDNRNYNAKWSEKMAQANISPATVNRILSLSLHYKKTHVTAKELAVWMNSTERNARRILTELESAGMAEISGEEQSGQKGRPRKVYKLLFIEK
ncbi:hypothetical protein [Saccharococcus sp. Marseille-Q5394]|uniref:hypothetical protein n=1 Tax=Saccharococcus sp. Marseille-Q5394 TaxID=2972778 RepID=UPI0021C5E33F|nr:hypothetical protein [Saccharococcus sp. Marseille-Q5394]